MKNELYFSPWQVQDEVGKNKRMSNIKLNPIVILLAGLLFTFGLSAQSVHFNYTDGTNASYNIEDVRKIDFAANVMNLHLWDGSVYSWNMSTIGYYEYDESAVSVEEFLADVNVLEVSLFPNPTNDLLNVHFNLPKEDEITIVLYDIHGKLVFQKNLGKRTTGETLEIIDTSNLPVGTYTLHIMGQNNRVSKKVIKQ